MKRTLLFLFLALAGTTVHAQSAWYVLQPSDTLYGVAPFDNLTIFDIYQFNNQPDSIVLKWHKVSEVLPAGWDFSLCDYAVCYAGLPQSGTMSPVAPGDSGFLGWNVIPNQVPGLGILRIYVYEQNHPDEGDTLTWIISTPGFNNIDDPAQNKISIYPIPAGNTLTVYTTQSVNQLELVSMTGQVLRRWNTAGTSQQLELSQFAADSYWLRIRSANGVVQTKRLVIAR